MTEDETTTEIFALPVFPAADVFPMLLPDDLAELAADIKANGLREPLVVAEVADADGVVSMQLVDGRNRREACRMVGVEPSTRTLNGEDPTAYVISANIYRRHMTKAGRAMSIAMIYPEARMGRGSDNHKVAKNSGVSSDYVRMARAVVRHAPDLAANVLAGTAPLDVAYKKAVEARDAAESELARIQALRERYPELADKVVEGDLTLAGAQAEAGQRDQNAKASRANLFTHLGKIVYVAEVIGSEQNVADAAATLRAHSKDFEQQERYSVDDLISAIQLTKKYLPRLEAAIRSSDEGQ